MQIIKRLFPQKMRVNVKLEQESYDYDKNLTGRIIIRPLEDFSLEGITLVMSATQIDKVYNTGYNRDLEKVIVTIFGPENLQKDKEYIHEFNEKIPFRSREYPFTEVQTDMWGVINIKDRPSPYFSFIPRVRVNYPFVSKCKTDFGGCGWESEPSNELVSSCPKCGKNLQEIWKKYSESLLYQARSKPRHWGTRK